jgi:diguanylate cyclase (GGDEF)-like protein
MTKMRIDIDQLTGIHNEVYLKSNYQNYISGHPNSKFIMFDFKEFKHFNDTFGHDVGDVYLTLFAKILEDNFKDSLVVRLHGDEYVVLTKYSLEEIDKIFNVCDARIKLAVEAGMIPAMFGYNAGIVDAEHGIANTAEKADYMMYCAKKKNIRSQEFKEEIWREKQLEDDFIKSINEDSKSSSFIYSSQDIYNVDKTKADIQNIYTRNRENKSLFAPDKYEFIRNNSQLKKIDLFNLQYLLLRINSKNGKTIINFDYKSLLSKPDLIEYLQLLVQIMGLHSNNLIISINVNDIESKEYNAVIKMINEIKSLGFGICLDRYSSKTGQTIYVNAPVNYIKFDSKSWKEAMSNPKANYLLKASINMFTNYTIPSIPIFTCIEKESEYIYVKEITNKPILVSGNYFEPEKKIVLKKD